MPENGACVKLLAVASCWLFFCSSFENPCFLTIHVKKACWKIILDIMLIAEQLLAHLNILNLMLVHLKGQFICDCPYRKTSVDALISYGIFTLCPGVIKSLFGGRCHTESYFQNFCDTSVQ